MIVKQAIYTSAETTFGRGYHLVSRSPGLTPELITHLNRWCPSHASLLSDDVNSSSLNFHALYSDQFVLSRTFYGRGEYSNRGGRQVVTVLLILDRQQLRQYNYNPLALARVARSLGHLRLTGAFPSEIPCLNLPETCVSESLGIPRTPIADAYVEQVAGLLGRDDDVAIVAQRNRLEIIEQIILNQRGSNRAALSFTTGLKPSRQRPFRLHLLPRVDTSTMIGLSSLRLHCIPLN